jgi:hypothetical protein
MAVTFLAAARICLTESAEVAAGMITVSQASVQDAWNELYNTTEEHAQDLVEEFAREQPCLCAFLSEHEEMIESLADRGFLLLYGVWAWRAFQMEGRDDSTVSRGSVEAAYERNQMNASLMGASNRALLDAAQEFTRSYRHYPLFGAIMNDIFEGHLESEHLNDDITGMMLLVVKSVIDVLDA